MKKKILFFFLFLLVSLPLVNAQPPFQESSATTGLDVRYPQTTTIRVNTTVTAHTHVYNKSNGLIVTNATTSCLIHLYNSTGNHILQSDMGFNTGEIEFELLITGTNFSEVGRYAGLIQCNSSTEGGFVSFGFDVTESGFDINEGNATLLYTIILFMMVVGSIFLIAFTKKEDKFQIKWTFFVVGYILFLSALTLAQISLRDSLVNPVIINYLDSFLAIAFILFWFAFGLLMVMWFLTTLQTLLLRKAKRNMEKYQ